VARKVKLLPRAEKELAALPASVQDQIISKLELLRDFPELGPAMFDAFEGYRALLAAKNTYRVIYRIVSDELIEVAYIRHGARQVRLRVLKRKGIKRNETRQGWARAVAGFASLNGCPIRFRLFAAEFALAASAPTL